MPPLLEELLRRINRAYVDFEVDRYGRGQEIWERKFKIEVEFIHGKWKHRCKNLKKSVITTQMVISAYVSKKRAVFGSCRNPIEVIGKHLELEFVNFHVEFVDEWHEKVHVGPRPQGPVVDQLYKTEIIDYLWWDKDGSAVSHLTEDARFSSTEIDSLYLFSKFIQLNVGISYLP